MRATRGRLRVRVGCRVPQCDAFGASASPTLVVLAQVCATIQCLYGCTDTFKALTMANDVTVTSAPVVRNARCDGDALRT